MNEQFTIKRKQLEDNIAAYKHFNEDLNDMNVWIDSLQLAGTDMKQSNVIIVYFILNASKPLYWCHLRHSIKRGRKIKRLNANL